jgi:hypothetical protein
MSMLPNGSVKGETHEIGKLAFNRTGHGAFGCDLDFVRLSDGEGQHFGAGGGHREV